MAKYPGRLTATEPARPLTYRNFYKGFSGLARSRKPGQICQPGSYEEAPNVILWNCTLQMPYAFLFLLYRPLTKEDKLNLRIQDLKEKNSSLSKVNSELQEELKTVSGR